MKRSVWNTLKKIRKFVIYQIFRLNTSGVRIILVEKNHIMLVKHPYDDFWVLPGGGIKSKEHPRYAAIRETEEEANIKITSPDSLKKLGKYLNNQSGKSDIVYVFVCKQGIGASQNVFKKLTNHKSLINRIEIEKQAWFPLGQLPEISSATNRRILEFLKNDYQKFDIRKW